MCTSINTVLKKDENQVIGCFAGGLALRSKQCGMTQGNPTRNPIAFYLTEGQIHDLEGADALIDCLAKADGVLVDESKNLKEKGVRPLFPLKRTV
ncbi:hypothetical protein [Holospora undulata]|uniref:Uncharacterized protein n=1 Tax=Holospora undulata HU1 TaxID=1321371 RepID=A0A061JHK3_9PROT|nr:hypothetical protein [Holospora undulata]ETZ04818.1 hypothetical protein K737_300773 [Holospora undulata HU1]